MTKDAIPFIRKYNKEELMRLLLESKRSLNDSRYIVRKQSIVKLDILFAKIIM